MIPQRLFNPGRCTAGAVATATLYDMGFYTPIGRIRVYEALDAYHDDPVARALRIVMAEGTGSGNYTVVQTVNLATDNHICLTGRRLIVPSGMYVGVVSTTPTAAGRALYLTGVYQEYSAEDNLLFG